MSHKLTCWQVGHFYLKYAIQLNCFNGVSVQKVRIKLSSNQGVTFISIRCDVCLSLFTQQRYLCWNNKKNRYTNQINFVSELWGSLANNTENLHWFILFCRLSDRSCLLWFQLKGLTVTNHFMVTKWQKSPALWSQEIVQISL